MVGQKLNFIVDVVEQHTWTQLISGDSLEIQHIFITVAFECYRLVLVVNSYTNGVTFYKTIGLNRNTSTLMELFSSAFMLLQLPPFELTM